ncbi:zinc-dependent peptidase [Flavihumibacter solisilvae]|uniref:Phenylalanyl-tRNA synthetase subunit alpha n=1 Tax=Flavihumibacter solisilvae TaxID=1349421 RepID=A0A0C1IPS2_9BACT|nr:M90 family metallopeptidase [Flavihumibacter solisilvae]KIC96235.1 hypothetical protein OI18_00225 [Flavihumibacter solisilvae]
MSIYLAIAFVIGGPILVYLLLSRRQKYVAPPGTFPESYREILLKDVPFYARLDATGKTLFEEKMWRFLSRTRITGVNATVQDVDKVYIAASAIIPIYGFKDWEYNNLAEVLLYPESFSHDFGQTGDGRNTLGVVGEGPLQRIMVLSQHELRQAFLNRTSKENTAIHEFVHLIDKSDGSVDGIPEFFVDRQYVKPWVQLIHKEIRKILDNRSDIDPYGATNEAEFFAVVSEYFFERPDLLELKHPELYQLLTEVFNQQPAEEARQDKI